MTISESEQRKTLTALGFGWKRLWPMLPKLAPRCARRADLGRGIARIASLTKLEGTPLAAFDRRRGPSLSLSPMQRRGGAFRGAFVRRVGLYECVLLQLYRQPSAALFGGATDDHPFWKNRSSSRHEATLRPSLLPALCKPLPAIRRVASPIWPCSEGRPCVHRGEPERPAFAKSAVLLIVVRAPRTCNGGNRALSMVRTVKSDIEAVRASIGAPTKSLQIQTRNGVRGLVPSWPFTGKICLRPEKGAWCLLVKFTAGFAGGRWGMWKGPGNGLYPSGPLAEVALCPRQRAGFSTPSGAENVKARLQSGVGTPTFAVFVVDAGGRWIWA